MSKHKKMMKKYGNIITVSIFAIILITVVGYYYLNNTNLVITDTNTNTKNIEVIKKSENISTLQEGDIITNIITSKGNIKIKMFPDTAPKTVTNFLVHAQEGYYDGLIFHRVIDNFMIQGGDPLGTGIGGKSIYGKTFEDEFFGNIENKSGTIAMANSGKNTNGSQFFINERDNNHLDGIHTVFGKVIEGMDIVDKITQVPMDIKTGKPYKDIIIKTIDVYQFTNNIFVEYIIEDREQAKKDAQDQYDLLLLQKTNPTANVANPIEVTVTTEEKSEKVIIDKERVAKEGDKVEVKYELKLKNGDIIDSNFERNQDLPFIIGQEGIIPGFSNAVKGMKIGETKSIVLEPSEAYGEYDEKNIQIIDKKELISFEEAGIILEVGAKIPTQYGEFTIKEVNGEKITMDMNSKLAGKQLYFKIKLEYFVN